MSQRSLWLACRALAALLLSSVGVAGLAPTVRAQYSPNCERNGRPAFCAYTPSSGEQVGSTDAGRLVFADHTVYVLQRDEASCRDQGPMRQCRAWILTPTGRDPIPATYRGVAYEGGYRHEYASPGLRLTYTFLD